MLLKQQVAARTEQLRRQVADSASERGERITLLRELALLEPDDRQVAKQLQRETEKLRAELAAHTATIERYRRMSDSQICSRLRKSDLDDLALTEFGRRGGNVANLAQIRKRLIHIGYSEIELRCAWGAPEEINRSVSGTRVHKQWVYGDFCKPCVYTDNGVVTSWQD